MSFTIVAAIVFPYEDNDLVRGEIPLRASDRDLRVQKSWPLMALARMRPIDVEA